MVKTKLETINYREEKSSEKTAIVKEFDNKLTESTFDPEEWLNSLKVKDEFHLVPGEIIEDREKAVQFKISSLILSPF